MEQFSEFVLNNWYLFLALTIVMMLLVKNLSSGGGANNIRPAAAVEMINRQDASVIDVRSDKEFASGFILGAENIPLGSLESRLSKLEAKKAKPIVVVCRSGQRSSQACNVLKKNGFEQIYNMAGGMMAWQRDSYPVEYK